MAHFTKDHIDFFKESAANNNKDRFNANKKRYETSAKDPFNAFLAEISSPAESMLKDDFCDVLMEYFAASEPIRKYLTEARGPVADF